MKILHGAHRGITLVELLVAMTIGLVLMVAIANAFLGASAAGRSSGSLGQMTEDAHAALGILGQHLKLAGANPPRADRAPTSRLNPVTNVFPVRGCDLRFSNITTAADSSLLQCAHDRESPGPGSITVGYEADVYNTVPTIGGKPTDCLGSGLTGTAASVARTDGTLLGVTVYEAENRFYVGTSTNIVSPTLYCKPRVGAQQPMVENVEDLRFTYGVSTPDATATISGFVSAWALENEGTVLAGKSLQERWEYVRAIRICVLMRSPEPVATDAASARYVDCTGELREAPDLRLRRAFTSTVSLRNRQVLP